MTKLRSLFRRGERHRLPHNVDVHTTLDIVHADDGRVWAIARGHNWTRVWDITDQETMQGIAL